MSKINYSTEIKQEELNQNFLYELNEDGYLTALLHKSDDYKMNWLSGKENWGKVDAPDFLSIRVDRRFTDQGRLRECYTFSNETEFDVFTRKNEVGIYTTFPDDYKSSDVCMKERCHAHIWCGKNTSYIYGLRMGGEPTHLGLILNQGSIDGYSVKRNLEEISNDRGSIILHPDKFHLKPGEKMTVTWDLVWFQDEEDFYSILRSYPNTVLVTPDRPVAFQNEKGGIWIRYHNDLKEDAISQVKVLVNGKEAIMSRNPQNKIYAEDAEYHTGEKSWDIHIGEYHTTAKTLVLPEIKQFAEKRCRFIVEKQQYLEKDSCLDGAFLIYDTEENCPYYSHTPDHNGGRERVGMGVLLAKYLQEYPDPMLKEGLQKYTDYIYRELYDEETGTVFNDVSKNNDWHRLYNYPWMAVFFMERYHLFQEERDLKNMYRTMKAYYQNGGIKFYAIGIPAAESVYLLAENKMEKEAEVLKGYYQKHADYIMENGLNYPPHEVNYEQSIVAPAVSMLLQVYSITRDESYLEGARLQMRVLELFNGQQPDYHLYETAIRHWDGFWFGKKRTFGDTFPHYWGALTGNAFLLYWNITGDDHYRKKAQASLSGTLSMISEDGSASCAYVYPQTVNGIPGNYADPWANDQDWGLYFYLKSNIKKQS